MASTSDLIILANLAEQTERFDDLSYYLKQLYELNQQVGMTERNLLQVGYKNQIVKLRTSWLVIQSIVNKGEDPGKLNLLVSYKAKIELELNLKCTEVIDLIENYLNRNILTPEDKVYYLKLKGDYNRYICEYSIGDQNAQAVERSLAAYQEALDISLTNLPPTHINRLSLALNFSVFYFEILKQPNKSRSLAQKVQQNRFIFKAYDDAIPNLESIQSQEEYKDVTTILQYLRQPCILPWVVQDTD